MLHGYMPGAIPERIAPGPNDPPIIPCGVIGHVAVSKANDLHGYFDGPSGGIESHFYVTFAGVIRQYRSIFYEADAQASGNSFFIHGRRHGFVSVEFEGMGPGKWTAAQLDAFKRIIAWVHSEQPFPLSTAPSWNSPGCGYHRLFRQWNPNSHSCPGDERVKQYHGIIEPWLHGMARGLGHAGASGVGIAPGKPPRFNPANYYIGAHGPWVIWLGKRLIVHGCNKHSDGNGYQPGPTFTKYDRANVADFQRKQGWSGAGADGFPGPLTLAALRAAPASPPKHKKRPRPRPRTRIQNFRARYKKDDVLDLAILRRSVAGGRHGTVEDVLHALEHEVANLPRR